MPPPSKNGSACKLGISVISSINLIILCEENKSIIVFVLFGICLRIFKAIFLIEYHNPVDYLYVQN